VTIVTISLNRPSYCNVTHRNNLYCVVVNALLILASALVLFGLGYLAGLYQWAPTINTTVKPNQNRAVEIVWNQVYRMHTAPPPIIWIERTDLVPDGRGFYNPLKKRERTCVNGLFWPYGMMIAWPDGSKYSDSALCHELYHAKMYIDHGIVDSCHKDSAWVNKESIIAEAIAALKNAGL
jgi:hypothetical protein